MLSIGVLITALPIWITFVASTHPVEALMSGRTPLWPGGHFLQNYTTVLGIGMEAAGSVPVGMMMWNSLVMALMIAVGKDRNLHHRRPTPSSTFASRCA